MIGEIRFDISIALSWMNCILAGAMSYYSIRRCIIYKCDSIFQKIRATLGLYWCVLYLWIALAGMGILPGSDPVWFGRLFVRPAFTLTLVIMVISSWRFRQKQRGQPKPNQ